MTVDRPDLDAIRAHASGGMPPGDAEYYVDVLLAEVDRLHTWPGLMSLLDEHYPDDIFKSGADPGVRIVSLMRAVDRLRSERDHYRDAIREHRDGCRSTDVDVDPPRLTDECRRIHDYGQCAESDAALWEALDFGGVA